MKKRITHIALAAVLTLCGINASALPSQLPSHRCTGEAQVCQTAQKNSVALINNHQVARLVFDEQDENAALQAITNFKKDLSAVAAVKGMAKESDNKASVIIVGTLGHSRIIDKLVKESKINVAGINGQWEAYGYQTVEHPTPDIDRALIIVGSDRRGTVFGLYALSEAIGVSPWNWWADVPVQHHDNLYITAGRRVDAPKVKYRGIFINDEDPALGGWAREKFGGFNHQFYEHVFELILRLKGNYLWPAMWGKAIYDDDSASPKLANEMGVVLGTSHHEPLTRAHVEWDRYGKGTPWDYSRNEQALKDFWKKGIERMGNNESLVTVGMRGDGDEPMSKDTAIALLERIVHDQRDIIRDVTHRDPTTVPQVWALYKEVQDYYDQGMTVPDDITLLFSDDNWGNIRRVPAMGAKRPGGYGMYYHYDYVGGPRNYKWLNTNQIERVWEQMRIAYEYGVDRIWIVNVGDIKPMEYPISFFMDYAWNPDAMSVEKLKDYPQHWAAQQFGTTYSNEIGEMLGRYTQFNARRKPELISPETYSLTNFGEADRVVNAYNALAEQSRHVARQLPSQYHDAYYQLVQFPIEASANLNELYVTAARNKQHSEQGQSDTNALADKVDQLFARDQALTAQYHAIGNGRWNHFMDQTHIGYTIWQQPDTNIKPKTYRIELPQSQPSKQAVDKPKATADARRISAIKNKRWVEAEGYIAIEAAHYSRAINTHSGEWQEIPQLGRTLSSMTVPPVKAAQNFDQAIPHLEYDVTLLNTGKLNVVTVLAPTLNYTGGQGFRFGVSIDDAAPIVVNMHKGSNGKADNSDPLWNVWVADNANQQQVSFENIPSGNHTIKLWTLDAGIVFERLIIATKPLPESYLGPVERIH